MPAATANHDAAWALTLLAALLVLLFGLDAGLRALGS